MIEEIQCKASCQIYKLVCDLLKQLILTYKLFVSVCMKFLNKLEGQHEKLDKKF